MTNDFRIAEHYKEPWSRADTAARGSFIVSIIAVIIAVLVAFIPIYWEYRNNKKHAETKGDILELRHDTTTHLHTRVAEIVREELQRISHTKIPDTFENSGSAHLSQATTRAMERADISPTAASPTIGSNE